jgi:AraC-like DNA-binding protein
MRTTYFANGAKFHRVVSTGRQVRFGFDRIADGNRRRHRHGDAYATVLLSGVVEQAGYCGRHRLVAGDVLVQPTLDCHSDRMVSRSLELVRLPWRFDPGDGGAYRGCDVEAIRRLAEHDVLGAANLLREEVGRASPLRPLACCESDILAQQMALDGGVAISEWAARADLSREWLSRQFHQTYDVGPARFRTELKARRAWFACITSDEPLAEVALATHHSDQSHMTRSTQWLTGDTPAAWRRWSRQAAA